MDSKDLKIFIAVYESGSLNKASKLIFMSPQGISKVISKIEAELNVSLFIRTVKGVVPNGHADILYEKSCNIIESIESINNIVKNENTIHRKELRVVFTYGVLSYLSLEFITNFKNKFPYINLNFSEGTDDYVEMMMRNKEASIGFLAAPINYTIYGADFFSSHKHVAIINQTHHLAKKRFITYQDLDNEPIVLIGRQFHPFHNNMNRFAKANVHPVVALETCEIDYTHQAASRNEAIGISVDFAASQHPYQNTVILPFSDKNCTWDTYIIYRKEDILSEEAEAFRRYALNWIKTAAKS